MLGHELSHVYNRDILISSVAGALASSDHAARPASRCSSAAATTTATEPVRRADHADPRPDRRRRSSRWRSAGPGSTRPTQSGAELTGDPLALASALRKLEAGTQALPLPPSRRSRARAHLMIANPFRGQGMASLFSTHPPMERADRPAGEDGQVRPAVLEVIDSAGVTAERYPLNESAIAMTYWP